MENSVDAAAYHQCCTTCMWAESYGFTDKSITDEIEDQPETNVNFHQLDGKDQFRGLGNLWWYTFIILLLADP